MSLHIRNYARLVLAALLVLGAAMLFVAPAAAAGEMEYVVQPGDNLSAIARRFGLTVDRVLEANPGIEDANLIVPGQVIHLPAGRSEGPETPPRRLFRWELEKDGGRIERSDHLHLIRGGDHLYRVARRYGITLEALLAANPQLPGPLSAYRGELLHIPVELLGEGVYLFYETPGSAASTSR